MIATPMISVAAEPDPSVRVINLWPQTPPAWNAPTESERDTSGPDGRDVAGKPVIRLGNVTTPQLHLYELTDQPTVDNTTILICPGGGYSILAWDLEGTEIAKRFNSLGYSAAVVKYRVPTGNADQPWVAPVQDIQRAVSHVRSSLSKMTNSEEIARVGLVGFSAGGNAAARVAAANGVRTYATIDEIDRASCKVDFAGLVYPWLMIANPEQPETSPSRKTTPQGIIPDLAITDKTPPMFFAHAIDDQVSWRNSFELFSALRASGVMAELHVYANGGHGFGARDADLPVAMWPEQMATWLRVVMAGQP